MNFGKIALARWRWIPARMVGDKLPYVMAANGGKIVPLRRDLIALDVSYSGGVVDRVKVGLVRDHPHKRDLPSNAPRVVKALFRKDVRLALLRAPEAWPFIEAVNAAHDAWDEYTRRTRA